MTTSSRQVANLNLQQYFDPECRAKFCDSLLQALSEYGFVIIRNHGIDPAIFRRAYSLAENLFSLPLEVKQQYERGGGQRGYISFGKETAKGSRVADLKEYWHVGPEIDAEEAAGEHYPPNVWPEEIPEFREFFTSLHDSLNQVAVNLLEALAIAMHLEQDFFSSKVRHGNSVQRLIHYPPQQGMEVGDAVRAAAHADINLMTLLIGATDSGLQLLDRDGTWIPVNNEEGELVVDTGDMMARFTNHFLPSTIHRVVNPQDSSRARFSIPFFVHPRNSVTLECLQQFVSHRSKVDEPISAGDFLHQRLRENGFYS